MKLTILLCHLMVLVVFIHWTDGIFFEEERRSPWREVYRSNGRRRYNERSSWNGRRGGGSGSEYSGGGERLDREQGEPQRHGGERDGREQGELQRNGGERSEDEAAVGENDSYDDPETDKISNEYGWQDYDERKDEISRGYDKYGRPFYYRTSSIGKESKDKDRNDKKSGVFDSFLSF